LGVKTAEAGTAAAGGAARCTSFVLFK
jgi:hypothetical protein